MSVSVVIPTSGRPSLWRAVKSALDQDSPAAVRVQVVADGADALERVKSMSLEDLPRVRVASNAERSGAARSRNVGTAEVSSEFVAYLDDDDEWLPEKLNHQMVTVHQMASEGHSLPVVSCLAVQRTETAGSDSRPVPSRVISPDERPEDYLFRARGPVVGRASLFTSTLVVPRALAIRVPWDDTLSRHQDWDWILRLFEGGASIRFSEHVGVRIYVNSASSISASSNWDTSLAWVNARGRDWAPRTQVDFLTGQPLRYAFQKRDLSGIRAVTRAIADRRRLPHLQTALLGVAGILGRKPLAHVFAASGALHVPRRPESEK